MYFHRTRCQLTLPVQSQNVTKNRTDHRMHVEGPQICQINRWNNSFQNMYGMNRQKMTVRPGKSILCQKTPQKTAIFVCKNRSYLTLKGPGRQTVDTRTQSECAKVINRKSVSYYILLYRVKTWTREKSPPPPHKKKHAKLLKNRRV